MNIKNAMLLIHPTLGTMWLTNSSNIATATEKKDITQNIIWVFINYMTRNAGSRIFASHKFNFIGFGCYEIAVRKLSEEEVAEDARAIAKAAEEARAGVATDDAV